MTKRRSVGLALSERSVVAVEVGGPRGDCEAVRAAEFAFPPDISWDDPVALGEALRRFLHQNHMTGVGVVGLPIRWLATAERTVPPASRQALVGILRLAAERAFSLGSDRLVCDYASAPPAGKPGTALLVGATRERLGSVIDAVGIAHLKLRAVTSAAAALAVGSAKPGGALTAVAVPDGIEIVRHNGGVAAMRHIAIGEAAAGSDASVAALRLAIGSVLAGSDASRPGLAFWDGRGDADEAVRAACDDLGVAVDLGPELPVAGLREVAARANLRPAQAAPAAAVAAAGLDPDLLPFDLLHSRLTARQSHRWHRPAVWAACLLLTLLIAGAFILSDHRARRAEIADLKARLEEMAPSIEAAKSVVESVNEARGWYDRRPPYLDCLLALTRSFPEDPRVWATTLVVQEDMGGLISGKATDEEPVYAVLDSLKSSGAFAEIKLLHVQETRGAGGERTFSIAFTYIGAN